MSLLEQLRKLRIGSNSLELEDVNERKLMTSMNRIRSIDPGSDEEKDFDSRMACSVQSEVINNKSCSTEADVLKSDRTLDALLLRESEQRMNNPSYQEMYKFRQKLPSIKQEKEILQALQTKQVILVSGETGCGKTTQVPQFILDSFIQEGHGSLCHVVCTQPRRISAISVAERVAKERAEECGGRNSSIGWQIRLESKIPRQQGSIIYCTTGIVLQWLRRDRFLKGISHIVLDEIHERDLDSDFLMIILKGILPFRPNLKLILMSATLNAEVFSTYFANCPTVHIPGYTYPVEEIYLEDILEKTGYEPKHRGSMKFTLDSDYFSQRLMLQKYSRSLADRYSTRTVKILSEWKEEVIDLGLIVTILKHISLKEKEGAVLVFLPGWAEISGLYSLLKGDYMFNNPERFLLVPLHSMLPTVNQQEVFNPPPEGIRKIIIATNIAETSITINDVVFVVDSGFIKMENFDLKEKVSTLKPQWISLANGKQRRGRAGRVQPGICYKMYTRARETSLDPYCLPEMLRTRLETLCLKIKILEQGDISQFLTKAMNPPPAQSVTLSVQFLKKLNALDDKEDLTPLGFHLARLPLDPQTGKMIIYGAIFSCLDPILTIAASLTFKDAFVRPMRKDRELGERKVALAKGSQSDHLMLANAFHEWEEARKKGNDRNFCHQNFLSFQNLKMLSNLKKQYADYLHGIHFLDCADPKHEDFNRNSENIFLLKAVICAGLYPNIAKLPPFYQSFRTGREKRPELVTCDGKASIHPKSVNFHYQSFIPKWAVYFQKIKTTKVFLHDVTVVNPYVLLFFGGHLKSVADGYSSNLKLSVEPWIPLTCPSQFAKLLLELRVELDNVLKRKISCPGRTNWLPESKEGAVLQTVLDLLSSKE